MDRYAKVVRGSLVHYIREDVFAAEQDPSDHRLLMLISDVVYDTKSNSLVKHRSELGRILDQALLAPEVKPLVWTSPAPPNEMVRYDHVIAETPFGRFLITWKGWKESDSPTIDETPWGEWGGAFTTVEQAMAAAEAAFTKRIHESVGTEDHQSHPIQ